jgi:hypothetical protein
MLALLLLLLLLRVVLVSLMVLPVKSSHSLRGAAGLELIQ